MLDEYFSLYCIFSNLMHMSTALAICLSQVLLLSQREPFALQKYDNVVILIEGVLKHQI